LEVAVPGRASIERLTRASAAIVSLKPVAFPLVTLVRVTVTAVFAKASLKVNIQALPAPEAVERLT